MKVKINYGIQSLSVDVPAGTTVGTIRKNPNYRAVLGFGETTQAKAGGLKLGDDVVLSDNSEITIETACQEKA